MGVISHLFMKTIDIIELLGVKRTLPLETYKVSTFPTYGEGR